MLSKLRGKPAFWLVNIILLVLLMVLIFNRFKPLPPGLSYEGGIHETSAIEFLTDLTYETSVDEWTSEQMIFEAIFEVIEAAEKFVLVDIFLFNDYADDAFDYPALSSKLTDALIKQKQTYPDLQVVLITDPINSGYHSYEDKHVRKLKDRDIEVVLTDLSQLRDSNPAYSAVWRTFFQVFGQRGIGWLPNSMSEESPKITLRSYLKALNVKANHRKTIVTENEAIVSSANAHAASGFHSNIAFKVSGSILKDIVEAEQAVINYSGGKTVIDMPEVSEQQGDVTVQYVTEGKILTALIKEMEKVEANEEIWLGMFYLADRQVIQAFTEAAERGVQVNLILDPNETSFGRSKSGLPNLPIADELNHQENITIRWYNAGEHQYHTKLIYLKKKSEHVVIGGSANYTTRNLADLNLESDLVIKADEDETVMQDVDAYFKRMWLNEDGIYSVDYEEHEDALTPLLKFTYWLQNITGLTTY